MVVNNSPETRQMSKANAISVLKKFLTGSFVILFVGICAYLSLVFLMILI